MAKAQTAKADVPAIGVVEPPKMSRGGRSGSQIPTETLQAWLDNLNGANGQYVGTGDTFDTKGKTQSKAQRLKAALVDFAELPKGVEIATRVWESEPKVWHFALRLRNTDEK